jgi:hypothetical protein
MVAVVHKRRRSKRGEDRCQPLGRAKGDDDNGDHDTNTKRSKWFVGR